MASNSNLYNCPLCLFNDSESPTDCFVAAACGHIFHLHCILKMTQRNMSRCPMNCSQQISHNSLRRVHGLSAAGLTSTPSAVSNEMQKNVEAAVADNSNRVIDTFKVVLLGNASVGKTAILRRFGDHAFSPDRNTTTVGMDICFKLITFGDLTVQLAIWDTGGQEASRSITSAYMRDAHGIIFVYDITRKETFDKIPYWIDFAEQHGSEDSVRVMIGNKSDIPDKREVDSETAKILAKSEKIPFFEASAKNDINCEAAFRAVAAAMLQNQRVLASLERNQGRIRLRLRENSTTGSGKKCCGIHIPWFK